MAKDDSLADVLFNRTTVEQLAACFAGAFDSARFTDAVMTGLQPLPLKARIAHIADVLVQFLPDDFEDAAEVIDAALPPPLDPALRDDDFGHFVYASLGVYD